MPAKISRKKITLKIKEKREIAKVIKDKQLSLRQAEQKYNVPKETLRRISKEFSNGNQHCEPLCSGNKKRRKGGGRKRKLSNLSEYFIFDWILEKRERLLQVTNNDILNIVSLWFNMKVTYKWVKNFNGRWLLSSRKSNSLDNKPPKDLAARMRAWDRFLAVEEFRFPTKIYRTWTKQV